MHVRADQDLSPATISITSNLEQLLNGTVSLFRKWAHVIWVLFWTLPVEDFN